MSRTHLALGTKGQFVDAYRSDTGEKIRVPAADFDHPTLSKGIRKTPLQKAAENKAAEQPNPAPAAGDKKGGK